MIDSLAYMVCRTYNMNIWHFGTFVIHGEYPALFVSIQSGRRRIRFISVPFSHSQIKIAFGPAPSG